MNYPGLLSISSALLLGGCGGAASETPSTPVSHSLAKASGSQSTAISASTAIGTTNTGGFSTATGSTAKAVTVTTLSELMAAFNARAHHIIVQGKIYGGPKLSTLTFQSTDWNNTTIEGAAGGTAILENLQLKFSAEMLAPGVNLQNIIIKNITFRGNIADLQALLPQISAPPIKPASITSASPYGA